MLKMIRILLLNLFFDHLFGEFRHLLRLTAGHPGTRIFLSVNPGPIPDVLK